jgi:DNA polymerase-1
VLVCLDARMPSYRHELLPAYQGQRDPFAGDLCEQLDRMPEMIEAFGFAAAKIAPYEADDLLATAVTQEEARGGGALVVSSDRDTYQLVSDVTAILHPRPRGQLERVDRSGVRERYGVEPEQVPDFIALRGDPSDKLPGVPGVGPQGAADIIRRHGSLEAALKAGRFPALAEQLRMFRSIATMNVKAPLPRVKDQKPTWAKASALARDWQLTQLADRLAKLAMT